MIRKLVRYPTRRSLRRAKGDCTSIVSEGECENAKFDPLARSFVHQPAMRVDFCEIEKFSAIYEGHREAVAEIAY